MSSPTSIGMSLLSSLAYLLGQQDSVGTKQNKKVKYCSATCPDPQCHTKLYFPSHEASVECTSCGQRHSVKDLPDKQDLKGREDKFGVELMQFKQLSTSGKKTPELVKVKGISNYQCKLLSPLLTMYGMDKSDQAKPLKELGMGDMFDCSKLASRAFAIEESQLGTVGYGRDRSGSARYLSDMLNQLKLTNENRECLVPVHADGDGHCLVHAISRCLVGRELFWHAMRTNLHDHLLTNQAKYKEMFKDFYAEEDWPDFIAEAAPEFQPTDGQEFGLRNIHIFGLANVLRRPIILLDSLSGMQSSGDYSGIFLPALHTPEDCCSKDASGVMKPNSPIVIAWSTSGRNHFIPLVPIKGQPLPKLPPSLRPKVWGIAEEKLQDYVTTDTNGCIKLCSGKELADKYLQKLVVCMEKLFFDKNGVVPSLVADVNQYVYKSAGCVGVSPEMVTSATRDAVEDSRLFRCLMCNAISCVPPDWLKQGGTLYSKAADKFDLVDQTPYAFPLDGVTAIYDAKTDSFKAITVNCFWCTSTARPVKGDDSIEYQNADRTTTISKGSRCGCGFMHYWDGKEYDNLPEKIPLTLTWAGRTVQITAYWFQYESDPERNSNVYEVAQKAVTDNFPGEFGSERLVQQVVDLILAQTARRENMEQVTHSSSQVAVDRTPATPAVQQPQDSSPVPASKFIITGQKTKTLHKEELTMSETERRLGRQIEEKARLQQQRRRPAATATSQERKREAPGSRSPVRGVSPPPPTSSTTPPSPPSPTSGKPAHKRIRVTSSEGKTANLTLEPSVTFSELQAAIERELRIPAEKQRLRSGFPPRELRPSSDPSLPVNLANGERVSVDVIGPPAEERSSPQAAPSASSPGASTARKISRTDKEDSQKQTQQSLNDVLQQMLSGAQVDLWSLAQHQPQMFQKGGDYYQQVMRQYGDQLKDHTHFQFKEFPNKSFAYNAQKERLELCLGVQHIPVGPLTPEQEQIAQAAFLMSTGSSEQGTDKLGQSSEQMMETVTSMGLSGALSKPAGSSVKAFSGTGHTLMDAAPPPSGNSEAQDPLIEAAQLVVQKRLVTLQSRERELHTQVRSINRQMVQADANQDGASVQDDVLTSLEVKLLDVSSELKKVREEIKELTTL